MHPVIANPVTRLLGALVLTTPLLLSVDWVSAATALVLELLLLPALVGMGPVRLLRRSWPILLAAPISGVSMLLYGRPDGQEYVSFLFARITDNSIALAIAISLRVLAVGLPAIILSYGVTSTQLADGLAQILKLPAIPVLATVAGVRLAGLFAQDYQAMELARRARGVGDQGRIRRFFTVAFALLVFALRRGTKLATAMEARGFGATRTRTWARPSTLGAGDVVLGVVCLGIAAAALGLAVATGEFRFLGTT